MPVPAPPRFLQALLDLNLGNDEEGWLSDCPICYEPGMTIRPDIGRSCWVFTCPGGCGHQEVTRWLQADTRLHAREDDDEAIRGWMCMMLAPTLELYEALLAGRPVATRLLRQEWVTKFSQAGVLNKVDPST